jgi:prepilin-type N-terminal cleavage/methylation domain-containing protein
MINKLRVRAQSDSGFTLVELLVVMLILGLLAAIAIPSFFNQRDKARDADAKTQARTAQTAIETYATDNDGEYNSSNRPRQHRGHAGRSPGWRSDDLDADRRRTAGRQR